MLYKKSNSDYIFRNKVIYTAQCIAEILQNRIDDVWKLINKVI